MSTEQLLWWNYTFTPKLNFKTVMKLRNKLKNYQYIVIISGLNSIENNLIQSFVVFQILRKVCIEKRLINEFLVESKPQVNSTTYLFICVNSTVRKLYYNHK